MVWLSAESPSQWDSANMGLWVLLQVEYGVVRGFSASDRI